MVARMCGIAGKVSSRGPVDPSLVERMCAAQEHRGPDSRGLHSSTGVALGIQRLKVIDLETGDQPIYNEDRTVAVVLNGEVYNFRELREELRARGHVFATAGDTEVIVHLYEEMGPDLVRRLNGMFCFALWDARRERLLIARDRVGKKPLNYYEANGELTFASELAALAADAAMPRRVDSTALDAYLAYGYVPAPSTIWQGVRKLPPGHMLIWEGGRSTVHRYWRLDFSREDDRDLPDLEAAVREQVSAAVRRRLISDVPLGAFLSGGVDSSVVVAEMAFHSSMPVKTFSIGFADQHFNELPKARQIAELFSTDHHEFEVEPDAVGLLPKLVRHYGEPYADSSAIPSFHLAEQTRDHVTVALNGDGGDENFAGYLRHVANSAGAFVDHIPLPARRVTERASAAVLDAQERRSARVYARRYLTTLADSAPDRYAAHVGFFTAAERRSLLAADVARDADQEWTANVLRGAWSTATGSSRLDEILQTDVETYLPGDLLTKIDIATMASSLEARSPLLDPDVMGLAASIPDRYKVRRGSKKWILRHAYRDRLPREILDGPKRGFAVPLGRWLREDLRSWIDERLLDPASASGVLDSEAVQKVVSAHMDGRTDRAQQIWALVCLEEWHRQFA